MSGGADFFLNYYLFEILIFIITLIIAAYGNNTVDAFRRDHSFSVETEGTRMKAKELKILRKTLVKANRCDELLKGFDNDIVLPPLKTSATNSESDDLTEGFSPARRKSNLSVTFSLSSQISEERFQQILNLFERNMGEMYKNSSWGLNLDEKSAELRDDKARFLLVLDDEEKLSGFVHFRFEYDDEESPSCAVLYLYEIQIESMYRRCGVGKRLMKIAEGIAREQSMKKIVLTVFKKNQQAMEFYTKTLGYVIDESSPSTIGDRHYDYEILCLKIL